MSTSSSSVQPGVLLGMGNPLLDISATVKKEFIEKYNLKANDAILYEKEDIYDDLKENYGSTIEHIAGGATQNSVRVAQWILGVKKATAFFGCVGKDDAAATLQKCAEADSVDARYQVNEGKPTGRCAVLITGQDRSLVTKLDAANEYTVDHLKSNWEVVEKARFYYSAGFFLTVSVESMLMVAKHAAENGKVYAMNLSAEFLADFFMDNMDKVMALSEIVFGNETEALNFAKKKKYDTTNVAEIAAKMEKIPFEGKEGRTRTVVITQGAGNVIVVKDGETKEYPATPIAKEQIVDTNGAGDAFVGGFLAALVEGKDQAKCVKCGIWAATKIIQQSGCTFPEKMDFEQ